jgi:glycosyltransferase involved in cell wall biosynthesis
MKIAFIAPGVMPIPTTGWGAVEGIIWELKQQLERRGHLVDIANTRAIHEVIYLFNKVGYDFVHCHSELFLLECIAHLRCPFAVTGHSWLLHQFKPHAGLNRGFQYLFEDTLLAPANIVLSDRIRDVYVRSGCQNPVYVLKNAAETDAFRVAERGEDKAVCVGLISARKRQAWLADIVRNRVAVDFVGPTSAEPMGRITENETARYLGSWARETLQERLTNYSCLVLLSRREAAPRVVPEALAAGLSLVITEACTANLSAQPFITVLPDDETRPEVIAGAIQSAIDCNKSHRDAIRRYAKERFDYAVIVPEYLHIIDDIRGRFAALAKQNSSHASPMATKFGQKRTDEKVELESSAPSLSLAHACIESSLAGC